jgi:hypothetical protein
MKHLAQTLKALSDPIQLYACPSTSSSTPVAFLKLRQTEMYLLLA